MAAEFRLSVDQIIAAIGLLDEEEQSDLRLRLLAWLARPEGSQPVRRSVPSGRSELAAWEAGPPADEDDLYLYDQLMALGNE